MPDRDSKKPFRLDPSQEEKPFFKESTTYIKDQSVFCGVHHVALLLSEAIDTGEEVSWVWVIEDRDLEKEREDIEKVSDELFPNNSDEVFNPPSGCRPMGGVEPAYLYCPECNEAKRLWHEQRYERLAEQHIKYLQDLLDREDGWSDKERSLMLVGDYTAKLIAVRKSSKEFKIYFERLTDMMQWGEEERKRILKEAQKEIWRYYIMLEDGIYPIKEGKPARAGDDK